MTIIVVDFPVLHKPPQSRKTSRRPLPGVSRKAGLYKEVYEFGYNSRHCAEDVFVVVGPRLPRIYRAGWPTPPIVGGFRICIRWVCCGPASGHLDAYILLRQFGPSTRHGWQRIHHPASTCLFERLLPKPRNRVETIASTLSRPNGDCTINRRYITGP